MNRIWGVVGGLVGLVGTVFASWETKGFSVHFNEYEPDFGRPTAPIWMRGWQSWDGRSGFTYSSNKSEYDGFPSDYWDIRDWSNHRVAEKSKREAALSKLARGAEARGQWPSALEQWKSVRALDGPMAALAQDRLEVFTQMRPGFPKTILKGYLGARDRAEYRNNPEVRRLLFGIVKDARAGFLRAHAAYAAAALDEDNLPTADGVAYARIAFDYPKSPRAESALIMAARTRLRERGRGEWAQDTRAWKEVDRARQWLQILLRRHPESRFRTGALGWLARADFLQDRLEGAIELYRKQAENAVGEDLFRARISQAMCESKLKRYGQEFVSYLRLAGEVEDPLHQYWCNVSLDDVRDRLSAEDAAFVARKVRGDPSLLEPYLAFRLGQTKVGRADERNLASMAESVVVRFPKARLRPRILARLAEIEYGRGRYRVALNWALRAKSARGEPEALASYMEGSCRFRLGDLAGAERAYSEVCRRFPKSHLARAAREPMALVRERRGDLEGALDLYYDLQYDDDIAYLLDAKMTLAQVRAYAAAPQGRKRKSTVTVAYGYRLLRVGRFAEAEKVFASIPSETRLKIANWKYSDGNYSPFGNADSEKIDRFFDPLTTARELRHLSAAVDRAKGAEAKSEAMFALANYYRDRRHLLLYNASLWQGVRLLDFGWWWNPKAANRDDDAASVRHHREHECLMHTFEICRNIVRKYPKSKVAPQALYRAACAAYTLSNFNDWWRKEGKAILTSQDAVRLMKQLPARYPKHELVPLAVKYGKVWTAEMRERESSSTWTP